MWTAFQESDRRFVVQAYRIIEEQLYPPYINGKTSEPAQAKWKIINDRMSTELGLHELSPRAYSYQTTFNGNPFTHSGTWAWDHVCKEYVCKDFQKDFDPDIFMKNRMSFFEIAFREQETVVNAANAALPAQRLEWQQRQAGRPGGYRMPTHGTVDESSWVEKHNKELNEKFRNAVGELNTRLRQGGYKLNYHNGFIQIASDAIVEQQIETPFWSLVANPRWQNVDTDMKEAIDLRDTGGRDPAWYAARALESTIKIISAAKGGLMAGKKERTASSTPWPAKGRASWWIGKARRSRNSSPRSGTRSVTGRAMRQCRR